jgi:T5orf172 domain
VVKHVSHDRQGERFRAVSLSILHSIVLHSLSRIMDKTTSPISHQTQSYPTQLHEVLKLLLRYEIPKLKCIALTHNGSRCEKIIPETAVIYARYELLPPPTVLSLKIIEVVLSVAFCSRHKWKADSEYYSSKWSILQKVLQDASASRVALYSSDGGASSIDSGPTVTSETDSHSGALLAPKPRESNSKDGQPELLRSLLHSFGSPPGSPCLKSPMPQNRSQDSRSPSLSNESRSVDDLSTKSLEASDNSSRSQQNSHSSEDAFESFHGVEISNSFNQLTKSRSTPYEENRPRTAYERKNWGIVSDLTFRDDSESDKSEQSPMPSVQEDEVHFADRIKPLRVVRDFRSSNDIDPKKKNPSLSHLDRKDRRHSADARLDPGIPHCRFRDHPELEKGRHSLSPPPQKARPHSTDERNLRFVAKSTQLRFLESERRRSESDRRQSVDATNSRVKDEMKQNIKQNSWVYIFSTCPPETPRVKIGITGDNPQNRMLKTERTCQLHLQEELRREVPFRQKVERLVHLELEYFKWKGPCACNTMHKEWFEVEPAIAKDVVDRWIDFVGNAYHGNGSIRSDWSQAIIYLRDPSKGERDSLKTDLEKHHRLRGERHQEWIDRVKQSIRSRTQEWRTEWYPDSEY